MTESRPNCPGVDREATGLGVAAGLMLLAAVWLWLPSARSASIAAREGAPVRTVRAVARDMPRYVDTVGTVQAFNTVVVRSRVDGEIGRIAFREGQNVRKGDVLVELDRRPFEAQLRLAIAQEEKDRALLDNAQVDLARYEQLMQTDSTSRQVLDTARSLVRQLEATVKADAAQADAAKLQVEYATIRAPIDGRTGARLVDIGNMVRATDTGGLVVVTQLDPIFVNFSLPQETLPLLRASQAMGSGTVTALSQNGSSVQGRGKLTLVDNQVDSATGTIRCKATLPNSNETLWPGQFVTARVLLETIRNVVVVPTAAVQSGPEGAFVYMVKEGVAAKRNVKLGPTNEGSIAVTQGLTTGEEVVVEGQFQLEPGAHVTVK